MSTSLKNKFEELNMSQDEINRFTEAMKKEEFRKLLIEYAEEISDPKNRELYEQEITKLEEERGVNCTFIHPEPGYCVKTIQNGDKKCFINICKNSNIDKPSAKRDLNNNKGGLHWQIPHSCSPARDDIDKSNKSCVVYDVVFNPDAYRMGETNQRFNQLLRDSAMDTIEQNYNVKLDKSNAKVLKNLNFKGRPTASVIRRPNNTNNTKEEIKTPSDDDPIEKIVDQLKTQYLSNQTEQKNKIEKKDQDKIEVEKYTKPNYKITYRGQADMQDYAIQKDSNYVQSTRPRELFISIELPLCKSSSDVILDIFEKRLYLESNNPFYKLDLNLSYPVNEKESKAKFDKSKRCLNVTLPVIPFVAKLEHKSDDENLPYSSSSSSSEEEQVVEKELKKLDNSVQDSSIKYLLPTKFELKQSQNRIYLKIRIENFDKKSIKTSHENDTCVLLTCESISTSGTYLTYYKAYINFLSLTIKYDQIKFISDDLFQVIFESVQDCNKVLISSKYTDTLPDEMSHDVIIIDRLNEELNQVVFEVKSNDNEEINKMSKKDYIVNFENITKKNDSDDDDDDDDDKDEYVRNHLISTSSTSSNDFDNGSSLSSSMNSGTLKGILKKSRSISEGEGSLRSSFESNHSPDGSNQELSTIKKSVSFNKQVVRNVFKPGSTITGMKRPNSNKNKKKNQKRNRTISDPSHNADNNDEYAQVNFRLRSFSESSDDSNFVNNNNNNTEISTTSETSQNKKNSNKKKKKKSVKINDQIGEESKRKEEHTDKEKKESMFNMEKMIQMKSQGVLPSDNADQHKTSCAFKIKNKIADDLD